MSRILIIEDEEAIAELEKDYLELSGFEVVISNRGDLGLEKALNEDFDLIILDEIAHILNSNLDNSLWLIHVFYSIADNIMYFVLRKYQEVPMK